MYIPPTGPLLAAARSYSSVTQRGTRSESDRKADSGVNEHES